jgi:hypothetical protein
MLRSRCASYMFLRDKNRRIGELSTNAGIDNKKFVNIGTISKTNNKSNHHKRRSAHFS